MPQTLILLPTLADESWLHQHHASGLFRATALFPGGAFAGLGLHTSDGVHPENIAPALAGQGEKVMSLLPITVPGPIPIPITAHLPELPVIIFVLCKVDEGRRQEIADQLAPLANERAAFAHAFHDGSINMVMEFVGDDLEETLSRVLAATDRPGLSVVETLSTTASLTRGFGGPSAPAS